ncbi:MAG TPA: NAD(P)-dependent oxidoreductase [Caulobacteraceae bacterium]|jgi:nucleoside-diphosphate-sugar epimerase|nr:NAD(P)-dependent oxidoreductase [Caulobacteraceae bacterium]
MTRVLVTGASGYIGRQTLAPLARLGFEVHGLARRPLEEPSCHWHALDLFDTAALAAALAAIRPTHLLHLAWTTEHGKFWTDPANEAWRAATLDLLDRFIAAGGRRCVIAGSCTEYDWTGASPLCEDRTPLRPATPYGQAKAATFRAVRAKAAAGLAYAHARLFFSYGPFEQPQRLVPTIIRALLKGEPARLTAGTQLRDFLDVRDVGRCLALLLASEVEGAVNVASGEGVSVARIAGLLGDMIGRPDLIQLGAVSLPREEAPSIVADISRLATEVGAMPEITLEQGLSDAVAWWRERT